MALRADIEEWAGIIVRFNDPRTTLETLTADTARHHVLLSKWYANDVIFHVPQARERGEWVGRILGEFAERNEIEIGYFARFAFVMAENLAAGGDQDESWVRNESSLDGSVEFRLIGRTLVNTRRNGEDLMKAFWEGVISKIEGWA